VLAHGGGKRIDIGRGLLTLRAESIFIELFTSVSPKNSSINAIVRLVYR